jgi:hypothetical protein
MTVENLFPSLDLLTKEYVLVQAWKKTAAHIRYHNWYSDTLALDVATVNLPRFLEKLAERFSSYEAWTSDPLRIVPAPKSQPWWVNPKTKRWGPKGTGSDAVKLRPLAHVSLEDQVAATAVMMCLADRVESLQGDPRGPVFDPKHRKRVVSYGNRLFCDGDDKGLRHRWGSAKLYRAYFHDYRTFLSRPEIVAEHAIHADANGVMDLDQPTDLVVAGRVKVVHSDLRQFYDRVQPGQLASSLRALEQPGDDTKFFDLAARLLNWRWDPKDSVYVSEYSRRAGLDDFSKVALPQGLVAAGFFANVALASFDLALRQAIGTDLAPGIRIHDICRYVDDLRIVLTVGDDRSSQQIEKLVVQWLQVRLDSNSPGLLVSQEKTRAAAFRGDERPLVRQSRKMARIQGAVSGGFDAIRGSEILDAVQGLIRSQQRFSELRNEQQGWNLSPLPDVRDATVTRFAAARFRSTYRSLRPLLEDRDFTAPRIDDEAADEDDELRVVHRTQADLDDDARAFALEIVEHWIEDPSNVRLLRIGLDLWPATDLLSSVLDLLRPFTESDGQQKAPRRVAWYCLAEVLRAGATETGFVSDAECLPNGVDIAAYRNKLAEEAIRLLSLPTLSLPWYLKQQAMLFLAAYDATKAPIVHTGKKKETAHYRELIRFIRGEGAKLQKANYATLAVLARRSFLSQSKAVQLVTPGIFLRDVEEIAERDPTFALEIIQERSEFKPAISPRLRDDLSLNQRPHEDGWSTLADLVLQRGAVNGLRNEEGILKFSVLFLSKLDEFSPQAAITPSDVWVKLSIGTAALEDVRIRNSRVSPTGSMFLAPSWCNEVDCWRFQLGYLLRFILTAQPDFTNTVRGTSRKEGSATYRPPESHWHQRIYGMFNGHSAFGDDWLPISDWTVKLLYGLLSWPGSLPSGDTNIKAGIRSTRSYIEQRLAAMLADQGPNASVTMLRVSARQPYRVPAERPLRACIIQTVIPGPTDFPEFDSASREDLKFSSPIVRKKHRKHLSAALAAVERMLDLRETHAGRDGRLDWLILPELSVHPDDVNTHLVPFARTHKTVILAGLTYQELFPGQPLVNSAIWVLPEWTAAHGLQISVRRQGKQHLSPDENRYNVSGHAMLSGFRPCQWLVGYEWSSKLDNEPLWLTAAICYDATDLKLATDLRPLSDVFAIPALNRDVKTFDQMALALHYHMFQMVIVANNGAYGGSNAYTPYREEYMRQVFHLHGQPQASIAFLEIDDVGAFLKRKSDSRDDHATSASTKEKANWKYPPAGV